MIAENLQFGSILIDGQIFTEDIIIDRGEIRPRMKEASRKWKKQYGHTPLSTAENIPWDCRRLIIGSGMYGSLPVMDEVKKMAARKGIELIILQTPQALQDLNEAETNFVLHLTC